MLIDVRYTLDSFGMLIDFRCTNAILISYFKYSLIDV